MVMAAMTQKSPSTDACLDILNEKLDRVLPGLESLKSIINNLWEVQDLKTPLNFAQENVAQLQKEVAKTRTTVNEHNDDLGSMDTDIEALIPRYIKLETCTRRENMEFTIWKKNPKKNNKEVVRKL